MKKLMVLALCAPLCLAACAKTPDQNRYNYNEVGQSIITEFVTIVSVKEVDITGRNTGVGGLAGGAAGGVAAGSYIGNGSGSGWAAAGGAVAGAVIGAAIEQEMANRKGFEYIVVTENKKTKTIVQNQSPTDKVFAPGEEAIMQIKGSYQRLIPVDNLPETVKKPKGFNIVED